MFELARLALSAILVVGLQIALSPRAAATPVAIFDLKLADFLSEARPHFADPASIYPNDAAGTRYRAASYLAEPSVSDFPVMHAVGYVFQSREFELNVLDDKYKPFSAPGSCLYPGTALRGFGESAEDCQFIKPGKEESDFFNLTFFAISGWVLVILAIVGLHYFYSYWRVRWWLRRMRAAGLVSRTANRRRSAQRRATRSGSQAAPRRRRYAG
jgi:hypothetical protein